MRTDHYAAVFGNAHHTEELDGSVRCNPLFARLWTVWVDEIEWTDFILESANTVGFRDGLFVVIANQSGPAFGDVRVQDSSGRFYNFNTRAWVEEATPPTNSSYRVGPGYFARMIWGIQPTGAIGWIGFRDVMGPKSVRHQS